MYSREKILEVVKGIQEEAACIAPYVIICAPRRDEKETPAQNVKTELGLHIDLLGYSHSYCEIAGEKIDVARNYLIEAALASGAKYMLFVGEDTVLPYDAFPKLLKTVRENPKSCAVGVYYIKNSAPMVMLREGNRVYPADVSRGKTFEVWQAGMDAMLIPTELLREMKEKEPDVPFACIYNYNADDGISVSFIGEDNFFYYRARKYGWKILCNTDVQCLHMDLATGKYTASDDIDLDDYYTNIPITERLTLKDKKFIDKRWIERLPEGTAAKATEQA